MTIPELVRKVFWPVPPAFDLQWALDAWYQDQKAWIARESDPGKKAAAINRLDERLAAIASHLATIDFGHRCDVHEIGQALGLKTNVDYPRYIAWLAAVCFAVITIGGFLFCRSVNTPLNWEQYCVLAVCVGSASSVLAGAFVAGVRKRASATQILRRPLPRRLSIDHLVDFWQKESISEMTFRDRLMSALQSHRPPVARRIARIATLLITGAILWAAVRAPYVVALSFGYPLNPLGWLAGVLVVLTVGFVGAGYYAFCLHMTPDVDDVALHGMLTFSIAVGLVGIGAALATDVSKWPYAVASFGIVASALAQQLLLARGDVEPTVLPFESPFEAAMSAGDPSKLFQAFFGVAFPVLIIGSALVFVGN